MSIYYIFIVTSLIFMAVFNMNKTKRIKKILLTFLLIYLCLVGALYFMQRSMIYFPSKDRPDITPYTAQGVFETTAGTADSIALNGWMRSPDLDQPTIVFFHGNASGLNWTVFKAAPYAQEGYGFLLAGYRGYGGNSGKPSELGFYEDARSWINKLLELGIPQEKIILYGESIGTGVAVQMATEFPNVRAVILESPYTSLPDVAAKTYFFVPVRLLMKDRFDSLSKIENVTAPVFIMQGADDKIIPPVFGKKLFDAANQPKDILTLSGHGHNNMPIDIMAKAAMDFLIKN